MGELNPQKAYQTERQIIQETNKKVKELLEEEMKKVLSNYHKLELIIPVRSWQDALANFNAENDYYLSLWDIRNERKRIIKRQVEEEIRAKYQNASEIQSGAGSSTPVNSQKTETETKSIPWDKMPLDTLHDYRMYKKKAREEGVDAASELIRLLPIASTQLKGEKGKHTYSWNWEGYEYHAVKILLQYMYEINMTVKTMVYTMEYESPQTKKPWLQYRDKKIFAVPFANGCEEWEGFYEYEEYYIPLVIPGANVTYPKGITEISLPIRDLYNLTVDNERFKIQGVAIIIDDSYKNCMFDKEHPENNRNNYEVAYNAKNVYGNVFLPKYRYIVNYFYGSTDSDGGKHAFDDTGVYDDYDYDYEEIERQREERRRTAEELADYYGWDGSGDPHDFIDDL